MKENYQVVYRKLYIFSILVGVNFGLHKMKLQNRNIVERSGQCIYYNITVMKQKEIAHREPK